MLFAVSETCSWLKLLPKLEQSDSTTAVDQSMGTDGVDFFVFPMEKKIATPDTNSTNMECLQYLEDKTYSLEALHKFPSVKNRTASEGKLRRSAHNERNKTKTIQLTSLNRREI